MGAGELMYVSCTGIATVFGAGFWVFGSLSGKLWHKIIIYGRTATVQHSGSMGNDLYIIGIY